MEKQFTRRSFLKRAVGTIIGLTGITCGGYFYANRIEPFMLEINKDEITHPLIPKYFDGIKIIQFSDTHLGFHYDLTHFSQMIEKINRLQPDIIFFTGDLMDEPNKYKDVNKLIPFLRRLNAPLGKYCIYGNHDHGGYGTEIYRGIMEQAGFTILLNSSANIIGDDGNSISIVGIDDAMLGHPDLPMALKKVKQNQFTILLSHAPDLAVDAAHFPIQWQLSGHSHGGQVKIPFVGAIAIPPYAKIYQSGYYKVGEKQQLNLYVNKGIGTTRLPLRFMVKPEIAVFTLKSAHQSFIH